MRPIVLIILDGWGYSKQKLGNAIASAQTPTIDLIKRNFPSLTLQASGAAVGLAWGETGNSEVGHLTIGAGRTVSQYSTRISKAIVSGDFYKNPAFLNATDHAKKHDSSLHIIGLLGSGTVHSSFEHLVALMRLIKGQGITKVYFHFFGDGKDSGLKELPAQLAKFRIQMKSIGLGTIATLIGRNYAMDRDNNWERTQQAFELLIAGKGAMATDVEASIQQYYEQGFTDTTIPATLIEPTGIIKDNDAVIFFNFREDSMRQISRSFTDSTLTVFPRTLPKNLFVSFMTQYFENPAISLHVAFPLPEVNNGLAEVLSMNGKKQLHIAETEKYAHATYFFNCLRNTPYEGEEDVLIPSRKDHESQMRAPEITQKFMGEAAKNFYDFTIINFANADVLSHIGNLENTIKGIESVDVALGKMYETIIAKDGILFIVADHGNAESLVHRKTGEAETRHDLNPVPLHLVAREYQRTRTEEEVIKSMDNPVGLISDIAPTILDLFKIPAPTEMTGTSLLNLLS